MEKRKNVLDDKMHIVTMYINATGIQPWDAHNCNGMRDWTYVTLGW